jgi:hypothetical protein
MRTSSLYTRAHAVSPEYQIVRNGGCDSGGLRARWATSMLLAIDHLASLLYWRPRRREKVRWGCGGKMGSRSWRWMVCAASRLCWWCGPTHRTTACRVWCRHPVDPPLDNRLLVCRRGPLLRAIWVSAVSAVCGGAPGEGTWAAVILRPHACDRPRLLYRLSLAISPPDAASAYIYVETSPCPACGMGGSGGTLGGHPRLGNDQLPHHRAAILAGHASGCGRSAVGSTGGANAVARTRCDHCAVGATRGADLLAPSSGMAAYSASSGSHAK